MINKKLQNKGGIATAKKLKQESLNRYYENPNVCLSCNKTITVPDNQKVSMVRKKKFCNSSCSAIYNNKTRERKHYICTSCGLPHYSYRKKWCDTCYSNNKTRVSGYKKKDVSKKVIYNHSKNVMRKEEKICLRCGYSKHVEICHIKPVKDFSPESLLSEINSRDNLVLLCPNCHWELDHNL